MGSKYIILYELYRAEGFITANLAQKTTGFSDEDLKIFWDAVTNIFELNQSTTLPPDNYEFSIDRENWLENVELLEMV